MDNENVANFIERIKSNYRWSNPNIFVPASSNEDLFLLILDDNNETQKGMLYVYPEKAALAEIAIVTSGTENKIIIENSALREKVDEKFHNTEYVDAGGFLNISTILGAFGNFSLNIIEKFERSTNNASQRSMLLYTGINGYTTNKDCLIPVKVVNPEDETEILQTGFFIPKEQLL